MPEGSETTFDEFMKGSGNPGLGIDPWLVEILQDVKYAVARGAVRLRPREEPHGARLRVSTSCWRITGQRRERSLVSATLDR